MRGEFAHAHQSLSNVHKYLLWLIRVVNQQTQHWESPTKNLENDIDKIWYSEYKITTSDLNPENLNMAFQNALKLSSKLFDKLNVEPKLSLILKRIKTTA